MTTSSTRTVILVWVTVTLARSASGLKILMVPTSAISHVIELSALGESLVKLGHSVSIVTMDRFPFNEVVRMRGLEVMTFAPPSEEAARGQEMLFSEEAGETLNRIMFVARDKYAMTTSGKAAELVLRDCEWMLGDSRLVAKVAAGSYDVAMADGFALGYCSMLLPYSLGIPFTVAYSGVVMPWSYRIPSFPSYAPMEALWFPSDMTYWQRVMNTVITVSGAFRPPFPALRDVTLLHRYDPELATWGDLKRRSLLYFIFKDHHLEYPESSMPNVIRVPGVTMRAGRPLAGDLADIYAAASQVVLVAFGSTASSLPDDVIDKLLGTFARFPALTFIMRLGPRRIEKYTASGHTLPANVALRGWLPQQDLLAGNKTTLFVSHGGNIGQWESLYHAVPMICLPMFADQPHNCVRMREKGFGVVLDIYELDADALEGAIAEMTLNGSSYRKRIGVASEMVRTARETPAETVSYWLEQVTRYGGAHLRSRAMDMPLYQFLMLDIAAGVLASLLTAGGVVYYVIAYVMCASPRLGTWKRPLVVLGLVLCLYACGIF